MVCSFVVYPYGSLPPESVLFCFPDSANGRGMQCPLPWMMQAGAIPISAAKAIAILMKVFLVLGNIANKTTNSWPPFIKLPTQGCKLNGAYRCCPPRHKPNPNNGEADTSSFSFPRALRRCHRLKNRRSASHGMPRRRFVDAGRILLYEEVAASRAMRQRSGRSDSLGLRPLSCRTRWQDRAEE